MLFINYTLSIVARVEITGKKIKTKTDRQSIKTADIPRKDSNNRLQCTLMSTLKILDQKYVENYSLCHLERLSCNYSHQKLESGPKAPANR